MTSQDRNFLVFSDDWGGHPHTLAHLFSQVIERHPTVWVNSIGLRRPRISGYDFTRAWEKLRQTARGETAVSENLTVISPFVIPYYRYSPVEKLNSFRVARAVESTLEKVRAKNPIVVTSLPVVVGTIERLQYSPVVYYCVDDYRQWPGCDVPVISRLERRLLQVADICFATASSLVEYLSKSHERVFLLPQGVDVEHFQKAAEKKPPPPPWAVDDRPIVGFFGLLDERLNTSLIEGVARELPDVRFVFLGGESGNFHWPTTLENLRRTGAVPYEDLPQLAAYFDICWLPYKVNEQTRTVNPLKLREYLATGKQVISTGIPEARALADWLELVDTAPETVETVCRCLTISGSVKPAARLDWLHSQSWAARADEFLNVIENLRNPQTRE